nr:type II toxin-antitoxin system RelE/ParE family toxin [Mesorhizobium sp.]
MRIVEYLDTENRSPFGIWFERLDAAAASKVTVALTRMEGGNLSNAKSVGSGVFEFRIDWGPGYRIYFGRDGERIIVLVAGGTKQRQQRDIRDAIERWADYRRRKR